MKSAFRIAAALALLVAIAGISALFLARSSPVVYSFSEQGDPSGEPYRTLFNPFRDRSPERPAREILRCLSRGDTKEAIAEVDRAEARDEILALANQGRIRSWRLANRIDSGDSAKLFYWTRWDSSSSSDTPVWVSVKRSSTSVPWRVIDFRSW
jgi:hypothetical protein